MAAGRKRKVNAVWLYDVAAQIYWDLRTISEGGVRWSLDTIKHGQSVEAAEKADIPLHDVEKARVEGILKEEIRAGQLRKSEINARRRELEDSERSDKRNLYTRHVAKEDAMMLVRVPGEPDVLERLLRAKTPEAVLQICEDASNWPLPLHGAVLPRYLEKHPQEFIAAKNDPRFPHSRRPSSHLKQLWFLSRAIAGSLYGHTTRTSINLVGSKRPEQMFHESREGKPERRHRKAEHKS